MAHGLCPCEDMVARKYHDHNGSRASIRCRPYR